MRRTVLFLAGLALVPHLGFSAGASPRNVLAAVTVVSTEHSGRAEVFLPEDVGISQIMPRISGDGRMVGFVLRAQRRTDGGPVPTLMSLRTNACSSSGCSAGPAAKYALDGTDASGIDNGTLRRGFYDLFVLADGAPIQLELRIRGLKGTRNLSLSDWRGYELATLTQRPATSPLGNLIVAGDFTTLPPGDGMGILSLWSIGKPHLATAYSACFHFSDEVPDPPAAVAFLPGCPLGKTINEGGLQTQTVNGRGGIVLTSIWLDIMPSGMGSWALSASQSESSGAVALWLRFDKA